MGPVSDSPPPAAPETIFAPQAPAGAFVDAKPPRLLYVEDEENDVLFLRRAFEREALPVRLDVVMDGETAVAFLGAQTPHAARELPRLVLLDLNLPARSGFEVLEWLRGQEPLAGLPVVIFSSSGRPEDRERARRLGADDYLLKPACTTELRDLVRRLHEHWLAPSAPRHAPSPGVAVNAGFDDRDQ